MSTLTLAAPTARLVLPAGAPEADWHAGRALGLGGSDIAAILGMDKYRTPRHVWLEKRGELPDLPRSPQLDEYARWGHRLEDFVAQAWAEETNHEVTPGPGTLAHVDHDWMRANLDRFTSQPGGPITGLLECKNRSAYQAADWSGETPPDGPALQAHWYMAVTGYSVAYVAALVGGNTLRSFRIDRDPELIDHIVTLAGEFWATVLDEDAPPPPIGAAAAGTELLAHLWASTVDAMVVVDEAVMVPLLVRQAQLKAQIKAAEKELTGVENEIKDLLGPHEIAVDAMYRPLVTWKQNGTFSAKAFTAAHPELAAEHLTTAPVLDTSAIKNLHPDLHRAHRARVLRPDKGALK